MRFPAFLCAALLVPTCGFADDYKIGDLVVQDPVARATPATAMAGAGYFTIVNMGDTPDRLISVEADFPRVEMHDTKVENDIATMFEVEGVEIAPGDTVTFMPRGKHVMFMGLNGDPIEVGEEIPVTLTFETAGALEVTMTVETFEDILSRTGAMGMEMGHGSHGDDATDSN